MPRKLLHLIVFIEGFSSLGAEIIALRRLVPHVGSSIVVTAPTIGFFLLALALGYAAGARIGADYRRVVARNFLLAAGIAGIGLAGPTVEVIFAAFGEPLVGYVFFVGGVLCPLAWLLGQTVPILTNLMQHTRTGEASGYALYYSTLGSFLGSLTLSLIVMQWLGVAAAVLICSLLLVAGFLVLQEGQRRSGASAAVVALIIGVLNLLPRNTTETAYADYSVLPVTLPETIEPRAFRNNNSIASLLDNSEPPHYARYIHHIRGILLDELQLRDQAILVLGAGGFTLSHEEPHNRYTYVDIDPAIREIAEKRFLGKPVVGEFIADDARRFITRPEQAGQYAAAVVDVYSSHTSIPGHLVTREFWRDTRHVLEDDGVLIANLILDAQLATPYARNLLATIESVYGRCAVEVLHKRQKLSNVVLTCRAKGQPGTSAIYVDELNRADLDLVRSR